MSYQRTLLDTCPGPADSRSMACEAAGAQNRGSSTWAGLVQPEKRHPWGSTAGCRQMGRTWGRGDSWAPPASCSRPLTTVWESKLHLLAGSALPWQLAGRCQAGRRALTWWQHTAREGTRMQSLGLGASEDTLWCVSMCTCAWVRAWGCSQVWACKCMHKCLHLCACTQESSPPLHPEGGPLVLWHHLGRVYPTAPGCGLAGLL